MTARTDHRRGATRVLVTSTSFQDTLGPHQRLLRETGFEISVARGPLSASDIGPLLDGMDGLICGDDELTHTVLQGAQPGLRVISKYGVGLDRIDLKAAEALGVIVWFTPGVNHVAVAEHVFALLFGLARHVVDSAVDVRTGGWSRQTGHELRGLEIGIIGLGNVGREVVRIARGLGLRVAANSRTWDRDFAETYGVRRADSIDGLVRAVDVLTLHIPLTPETRRLVDGRRLALMAPHSYLINTARGDLVDALAIADALSSGRLAGYGADVLEAEPPPPDHVLFHTPNTILTPHIASRTTESVIRQGTMAVRNLIDGLGGRRPLATANSECRRGVPQESESPPALDTEYGARR